MYAPCEWSRGVLTRCVFYLQKFILNVIVVIVAYVIFPVLTVVALPQELEGVIENTTKQYTETYISSTQMVRANTKETIKKAESVLTCENYTDLVSYLKKEYDITVDPALRKLTYSLVQETLAGFEYVLQRYPVLQERVHVIQTYNTDDWAAAITPDGYLYFSTEFYSGKPEEKYKFFNMCADIESNYHPQGGESCLGYGIHEASHFFVTQMLYDAGYSTYDVLTHWYDLSVTYSKAVLLQCCRNKKILDTECLQISRYASTDYMEAIAEAMVDYILNGTEAAYISQQVGLFFDNLYGVEILDCDDVMT